MEGGGEDLVGGIGGYACNMQTIVERKEGRKGAVQTRGERERNKKLILDLARKRETEHVISHMIFLGEYSTGILWWICTASSASFN